MKRTFKREQEKKHSWRYQEDTSDGLSTLGLIYVSKEFLKSLGNPSELIITVEVKQQ